MLNEKGTAKEVIFNEEQGMCILNNYKLNQEVEDNYILKSKVKEEINKASITTKDYIMVYNQSIHKIKNLTYGEEKEMVTNFNNTKVVSVDVLLKLLGIEK
jgi:hypothetical protein